MSRYVALFLLLAATASSTASAQEEAKRKVHVIQQRPFIRALRAEIDPLFGYTVNESLIDYIQVAATARFHITEEWSIGGTYAHYTFKDSSGELAFPRAKADFDEVQDVFGLFPEKAFMQWFAGGEVSYVPVYGKFILFNTWTVHWDAFLTAGAGVTKTNETHVTGTLGVGSRLFLTRWLTLNFELKDHIYTESFKAGDETINTLVLYTGFGFFVPFGWDYEYVK